MAVPDYDAAIEQLYDSFGQPVRVETDAGVVEMATPAESIKVIEYLELKKAKAAGTPVGPRFSKFRMGGTG